MASALPSIPPPRLHRAAAFGEKGRIEQCLSAGDDINARDALGCTALLVSVLSGHTKCVETLLAAGADPSISDNGKFFPLFKAAQKKNLAMAKALIRANANVNAICDRPHGGTALSAAAFEGDKVMVKLLLDAGCDTSRRAGDGMHPLTTASFKGHTDVVTMLLDAGADVSASDAKGWTALTVGAQEGSCDAIRKLLEGGADVNQPGPDAQTALSTWPRIVDPLK